MGQVLIHQPVGPLRPLWPLWLCTVTVWLFSREGVAKSPCKCGCVGGIYRLSDYVPNELGGFLPKESEQSRQKPDCPLIGSDSNIFNLMGIAGRTLRENGLEDQAKEMFSRITQCQSYDSALSIIGDYVNIVPKEQTENMDMEMQ